MVKYTKKDYVEGLDEFFSKVDLKVDWSKMTVKHLEALSAVLGDPDKLGALFDLDVATNVVDQVDDGGGGLLSGGLMGDKAGAFVDGVVDDIAARVKKDKPLRSQIGSGKFIGRILEMAGRE